MFPKFQRGIHRRRRCVNRFRDWHSSGWMSREDERWPPPFHPSRNKSRPRGHSLLLSSLSGRMTIPRHNRQLPGNIIFHSQTPPLCLSLSLSPTNGENKLLSSACHSRLDVCFFLFTSSIQSLWTTSKSWQLSEKWKHPPPHTIQFDMRLRIVVV